MTKTKTTDAPQDDILPEPADDIEPAAPDAAPASEARSEEAPAPKPAVAGDDGRDAAVKRYRELRDQAKTAEKTAEKADAGDTDSETDTPIEADDAGDDDDGAPPVPTAPAAPEAAPKAADEPKKVALLVDGKVKEVTLEEAMRLAQIAAASDSRLEESKRILKEAREEAQKMKGATPRARTPEHQPGESKASQDEPDPSQAEGQPEHPPAAQDREKLKQRLRPIAERIQVGDADEGAEALAELMLEQGNRPDRPAGLKPEEVDARVDARLARKSSETEVDTALARFGDNYKDIVEKPRLTMATMDAVREELVKDIMSAGVASELVAPLVNDVQALALAQQQLRHKGYKLRTYEQLLDAAGTAIRTEFNLQPQPKPQTPAPRATVDPKIQERVDKKRAAPPQPRTAGVRGAVNPAPRPKTKAELIAEIRTQRGFPADR